MGLSGCTRCGGVASVGFVATAPAVAAAVPPSGWFAITDLPFARGPYPRGAVGLLGPPRAVDPTGVHPS